MIGAPAQDSPPSFVLREHFPASNSEPPLRDAGHYVTALSEADQAKSHWQTAAHELMMAAERGGILMLAEIAMRQALAHGGPNPTPAPRKKAVKKYRLVQ
jgi:hypothetical protein